MFSRNEATPPWGGRKVPSHFPGATHRDTGRSQKEERRQGRAWPVLVAELHPPPLERGVKRCGLPVERVAMRTLALRRRCGMTGSAERAWGNGTIAPEPEEDAYSRPGM